MLMADAPFPSSESSQTVEIRSIQPSAPDPLASSVGESLDEVIPNPGNSPQPIVGLGGSAGSLGALRSFFSTMAPDSGLAFVVVVHLSPDHESSMALLLQSFTSMSVVQVLDTVKVEPNCVYVIPPAKHLSLSDGELLPFGAVTWARSARHCRPLFSHTG